MHKGIQEAQSNNGSVNHELLILALQKYKDQGWHLGNDEENDETNEASISKLWKRYSRDGELLQHENLVALPKGEEGVYGDPVKEVSRDANLWYRLLKLQNKWMKQEG